MDISLDPNMAAVIVSLITVVIAPMITYFLNRQIGKVSRKVSAVEEKQDASAEIAEVASRKVTVVQGVQAANAAIAEDKLDEIHHAVNGKHEEALTRISKLEEILQEIVRGNGTKGGRSKKAQDVLRRASK